MGDDKCDLEKDGGKSKTTNKVPKTFTENQETVTVNDKAVSVKENTDVIIDGKESEYNRYDVKSDNKVVACDKVIETLGEKDGDIVMDEWRANEKTVDTASDDDGYKSPSKENISDDHVRNVNWNDIGTRATLDAKLVKENYDLPSTKKRKNPLRKCLTD